MKPKVLDKNVKFPRVKMWPPKRGPRPGARRGPKSVLTQRGRPGARVARAPAPPQGPPNGGEICFKTGARRRRTVRRPGARMRAIDGRWWRPSITAEELKVPRRRRGESAAGRGPGPQPGPPGGPRERRDRSRSRAARPKSRPRRADQVRRRSPPKAPETGATEVSGRAARPKSRPRRTDQVRDRGHPKAREDGATEVSSRAARQKSQPRRRRGGPRSKCVPTPDMRGYRGLGRPETRSRRGRQRAGRPGPQ